MWIRTMRRRGRSESLFVFEFTSIEEDYIPFIFHVLLIIFYSIDFSCSIDFFIPLTFLFR